MADSKSSCIGEVIQESTSGTAKIRAEFVLPNSHVARAITDDDAAEAGEPLHHDKISARQPDPEVLIDEPPKKKPRLSGAERKKLAREEGKKKRGMNTNRKFAQIKDEIQLCWKVAVGEPCPLGDKCYYSHNVAEYLRVKPRDIYFPPSSALMSEPPFVKSGDSASHEAAPESIDLTSACPVFLRSGTCSQGFKCRFLGCHIKRIETSDGMPQWELSATESLLDKAHELQEGNNLQMATVKQIRSRKYPTPLSDTYVAQIQQEKDVQGHPSQDESLKSSEHAENDSVDPFVTPVVEQNETPDVPMRAQEKRRLHWKGMLYLAPLTTVGNLPFRRLCVDYGAQITCSEMAVATSLLSGSKEEWSLVRRFPTERVFGIQVAGSKLGALTQIAEVFKKEFGLSSEGRTSGVDFVDVNCGCPIDLVFKSGAGSALLDTPTKLGKILTGMNRCLGDIPLTIKLRTGVKDGRNMAHKLMPKLDQWGVNAVTIHGRTRQQRYTRLADWTYIKTCVDALRTATEDEDLPSIPLFGGGDVYTQQGYWSQLEESGVDGIMIGRGALIKPWIFTEIQERRDWDISSRERLDMIRKYADYGLNHWGSDTLGVNTTRRFLCEALSFQYRYIPLGILESAPRINDRPPLFQGRNDLESLLSSADSRDWVKISEMFLGPAPEGWSFTPKHKSNAHGSEEANG